MTETGLKGCVDLIFFALDGDRVVTLSGARKQHPVAIRFLPNEQKKMV